MTDTQLHRVSRYENAYKDYKDGKMSEKEYEEYLSNQDENSFVGAFCKTRRSYFHGDLINAKVHIDKTVSLLENRKLYINSAEDLLNHDGIVGHLYISKIYMLAGEIYAKYDAHDKSLLYYQKSQYYLSQLDSEFNNIGDGGIVYSFRRVSVYALSDLIANSITVAHPSQMNDPFDSLFTLWASEENLKNICEGKSHIPTFSESFNFYRMRSFVGNKTLTSDNRLVRNIIMWSHYADDHKGYCIKYRLSKHFIKKSDDGTFKHHYLRRVCYIPSKKIMSVNCSNMTTDELFTTKSNQWSRESEIRLVSYDSSHKGDFLQLKLDDCSKIEAIYFGYRCSDSDQRNIMSIVGEKTDYYRMVFDPENVYSMIIEEIQYNPSHKSSSDNSSNKVGVKNGV